jgi:hypothetical protein
MVQFISFYEFNYALDFVLLLKLARKCHVRKLNAEKYDCLLFKWKVPNELGIVWPDKKNCHFEINKIVI